eukprot:Phypoly_transcript_22528.p1 GENE.Phypoly_transcript_22528~~Phypoly_transcript_22528.p1  ORF type:complete len:142 (-),score=26.35 Phypoly_transcript_22528:98-523(-)
MGTCIIPDELMEEYKKFKLDKSTAENSALILKVDLLSEPPKVVVDEIRKQVSLEEIAEDLTESQPRYIVYSYKYTHKDGRLSFPLVLIFYAPQELHPRTAMMYSSTKQPLVNKLQVMKTWDVQTPETLTEEWLKEKLAFFK